MSLHVGQSLISTIQFTLSCTVDLPVDPLQWVHDARQSGADPVDILSQLPMSADTIATILSRNSSTAELWITVQRIFAELVGGNAPTLLSSGR